MEYTMEELLPLVSKLSEKYTSKESTSITYETAQMLMTAVLYCLKENEASLEAGSINENINENTNEIISEEQAKNLELCYQQGYEKVVAKTGAAKALYHQIVQDFRSYGNIAWQDVMLSGMPEFFRWYDARFKPQDHLLTLDYPTLIPVYHLCGIEAIYQYLHYIQLEQLFLAKLPESFVGNTLNHYSTIHRELLVNVTGIVWRAVLRGKVVNDALPEKSCHELEQELAWLTRQLVEEQYDDREDLLAYLSADIRNFAVELHNAAAHDCVAAVFTAD